MYILVRSQFRLCSLVNRCAREGDHLSALHGPTLGQVLSPLTSAEPLSVIVITDVVCPVSSMIKLSLAITIAQPTETIACVPKKKSIAILVFDEIKVRTQH